MKYKVTSLIFLFSLLVSVFVFPVYGDIWEPWHSKDWFVDNFKTLCDEYDTFCSYESVGKSVEGNDIWLFKFGNPNGGIVFWDAQLHGSEDYGSEILWLLANWLVSGAPQANYVLENNYVLFVPVVNVDSYDRNNANDVNLNRNFETGWRQNAENPGIYACSEPETQVIRKVFEDYKPEFYVDLHQGAGPMLFSHDSDVNAEISDLVIDRANEVVSKLGVNLYRNISLSSTGFAIGDAYSLSNSSSWILELDPSWKHEDEDWDRLVDEMYPNCLAMFISMCGLCKSNNSFMKADFNLDNVISSIDLFYFSLSFVNYQVNGNYVVSCDFDFDGDVDFQDLLQFLECYKMYHQQI